MSDSCIPACAVVNLGVIKRLMVLQSIKFGMTGSLAGLHHLGDDLHQGTIFEGSGHSLLITELLVDLVAGAMSAFLDAHIDPEARWK